MQSIEILIVIVLIQCLSSAALRGRTGVIQNDEMRCFSIEKNGAGLSTHHAAFCLTNDQRSDQRLFVVLGLEHFTAAIKAVRADVMTHMRFTGSRLNRQLRSNQKIVRTMHAALGRRLLVLLNSHDNS
jgi:hypothetical protein